jgi:acetyltransferase-like isoleucine patch superfamily enzyme
MFRALSAFLRALTNSQGRFRLLWALFRFCPGDSGMIVRAKLLSRHLGAVGKNLGVLEGVFIRNPQNVRVGDNVAIGDHVFLQAGGGIDIGNDVLLGPGVKIWTQNHRFEDLNTPIRMQGYEYLKVVIGDDVWIGANAFIMPGAHLPKGCIVSAGAVVSGRAYKEYSILAGNPARVIGFRNVRTSAQATTAGGDHGD